MKTNKFTAKQCQWKSERAFLQAKTEARYGLEHTELCAAAGREWKRRALWAELHGGTWKAEEYENEKWDKEQAK